MQVENDSIIAVMPASLSNKIAAGEVVQRPSSVVKELVENAMDAGAGRIEVHLQEAGSRLIQIVDDGSGMSASDAALAFERHATSKIRTVDDLETIHTLGFRGEALASIASVSQVELRTRRASDPVGTVIRMDGGEDPEVEPGAAVVGTSISIRNLFYNVPARRNFLKRPQTELKHCIDTMTVLALSHPNVGFRLLHDGHELLDVPAAPDVGFFEALGQRSADLSTVMVAKSLIEVEESTSYLTVRGVLGSPDAHRKARGQQYLFVNGRHVRHRYLEHAVLSAYEYLLPEDTYPFFVLFLDIDPRHVDVNVHPTKAEVKFDDERGVYGMLRAVVRRAINSSNLTPDLSDGAPRLDLGISVGGPDATGSDQGRPRADSRRTPDWVEREHPGRSPRNAGEWSESLYGPVSGASSNPSETMASGATTFERPPEDRAQEQLLWQLHGAYILTQIRSGLVIIDQQAAHERVLYEQARHALRDGMGMSQQLLFPQTLDLSPGDLALLDDLQQDLQRLGFDVQPFGGRSVIVRGVPADIRAGDERSILSDVLDAYQELGEARVGLESQERLSRAIARKSAVTAGVSLSEKEMRALIDQLFQCEVPFAAPDGRPTIIKLSVDELRERFDRR